MEAPVIAALVAASAAVIGATANLYATYRLKVKEFRVTQIKSRIDTLEGAAAAIDSQVREEKTPEDQEDLAAMAIGVRLDAAFSILNSTEKQYGKYRWLLDPQNHAPIQKLLDECNTIASKLGVAKATRDSQSAIELIPQFVDKTDELKNRYEEARLSTIQRLYRILNKEVRITA